jgi:MazG family protein
MLRAMPIGQLLDIMRSLRNPDGGCPWDLEQTHASLKAYCIEEAFEVLEAIDAEDDDALRGELGDLLLQVVFHAQVASERGAFDFAGVCEAIASKMLRRHPHVFGSDGEARGGDPQTWEAIKARERRDDDDGKTTLDGVPRAMPALLRAERLSDKAAALGFDWPQWSGVRDKVAEELGELDEAIETGDSDAVEHELGDLLLAVSNLARHLGVRPEFALQRASDRFQERWRTVEEGLRADGLAPQNAGLDELERRWQSAKERSG